MKCRSCFEEMLGEPGFIKIAQPRWIGPEYFTSPFKVLLLLSNPGAGNTPKKREANASFRKILSGYRDGEIDLREFLDFQRQLMQQWGSPPGRFLDFYVYGPGLRINELAIGNIAWCSEKDNNPSKMLSKCFQYHTKELINLLQPHVVILAGRKAQRFEADVKMTVPSPSIVRSLHHAHRGGKAKDHLEYARIKEALSR